MNTVDIIIIALVFLSAIIGFWRGITREILGILSWVIAVVLTYFFHTIPQPLVGILISNQFFSDLVSTLIVFLTSLIILTSITYSFSDAVKSSIVGGADKVLGFLFGSFRGFFLIGILAFGVSKFLLKNSDGVPKAITESRLIPIANLMVKQLVQSIPTDTLNEWKDKLESFLSDISLRSAHKVSEMIDESPKEVEHPDE
jgi:membrane protein required for colicin V production